MGVGQPLRSGRIGSEAEIVEGLGLEGTLKPTQPQLLPWADCPPSAQAAQGPSNLALSTSRDEAPTAFWAAVPGPHHPLCKEFPPIILSKLPLV